MIDEKLLIRKMWDRYNGHYNNASRFYGEETEMAYRVLSDLQLTIEHMPTVGEWIPCSERLPEEPKENPLFEGAKVELYLVSCGDEFYPFRAFWNGKDFTDGLCKVDVEAWMPLPEPYKEGVKE